METLLNQMQQAAQALLNSELRHKKQFSWAKGRCKLFNSLTAVQTQRQDYNKNKRLLIVWLDKSTMLSVKHKLCKPKSVGCPIDSAAAVDKRVIKSADNFTGSQYYQHNQENRISEFSEHDV